MTQLLGRRVARHSATAFPAAARRSRRISSAPLPFWLGQAAAGTAPSGATATGFAGI